MTASSIPELFDAFARALEERIPAFLAVPEDRAIADGNLVLVAIHESGHVFGRFWGDDPVRQRQSALVAWTKANQVRLTRTPTGTYEREVYTGAKRWWEYGIPLPELIGWEGGLHAILDDGSSIALAFSGLRGEKDVALLVAAANATTGIAIAGS